jgi:hypothetical protein
MNINTSACCNAKNQIKNGRGLCVACDVRAGLPRKVHTLESALVAAADRVSHNPVGAARLAAWALRRETEFIDLRFEQGPAACASMLRR